MKTIYFFILLGWFAVYADDYIDSTIKSQYLEWYGGRAGSQIYAGKNDTAIIKAIAAGVPIKLLPGSYWFSKSITFTSNNGFNFSGTPRKSIIRSLSPTYAVSIVNCRGYDVSGFVIGNSGGGGIYFEESHSGQIRDILVPGGTKGDAFHNKGSMLVTLTNCISTVNYGAVQAITPENGFYFEPSKKFPISQCVLIGCMAEGLNGYGIYLKSRYYDGSINIIGCTFEGNHKDDIRLDSMPRCFIAGSYIESTHFDTTRVRLIDAINTNIIGGSGAWNLSIEGKSWGTSVYGTITGKVDIDSTVHHVMFKNCNMLWSSGYFKDPLKVASTENCQWPYDTSRGWDNKFIVGTQRIFTGTAAPTSGKFKKGDMVINSQPAPGTYEKWICTESGTPGTWKPVGYIRTK